jgi:hypothetical protein
VRERLRPRGGVSEVAEPAKSPRAVSDWLKADPGDLGSGLGFTRSDEFTSIPHKSPPLSIFMNNEQTETFDWLFVIYILIVCLCS